VSEFDAAWTEAAGIPGWLTRAQARRLWDSARRLGAGDLVVEIGSHQGRSTVVLARAAIDREARVVAIDPFVDGRLFGGTATRGKFERNTAAVGAALDLRAEPSQLVRRTWTDPVGLLYIDGKHDYWTVRDDLRWHAHLPIGGEVLIHDAFSSIGVTLGILRHVLPSTRLRYVDRTGSLARFEVARPSGRDRLRILAELPWWLRNIGIKVALRVSRLFGSTTPDPY
jgi:hypothetical protein